MSPLAPPATTKRTRRSHRRSRNGCAECKRRHIRCDERKPVCANCENAERPCCFPALEAAVDADSNESRQTSRSQTTESTNIIPTINSTTNNSYNAIWSAAPSLAFNAQHMALLHHASSVPSFQGPNRPALDIAVRRAVDCPYLLDQVLALTAFDLIHNADAGASLNLRRLATELQTRALASFTSLSDALAVDDTATAVPRFLFSGILGRHMLADTLIYGQTDFRGFMDSLINCLNLNRGITTVTPPARYYLRESEIGPMINVFVDAEMEISSEPPGSECDPLCSIVDGAGFDQKTTQIYRQAVGCLQRSFDFCRHLGEEQYPQVAAVFAVGVDAGFVDELRKCRPEALAVLAYFGVLLSRCQRFWAFCDAAPKMVRAIAKYLGEYWKDVLSWPLQAVEAA
ncbi:Putative C6 finger domain protein [[Torrubiella] hemipterigena]|uniref:Putative C6 finger domain protein n=1 Tax=[Torrubiella] hemipterigena TaxID=1531966 RepID=A0A0A1SVR4_9HYPO|nr:Putative C6 finger domain protein [[Torrubiella] hemipterigena]